MVSVWLLLFFYNCSFGSYKGTIQTLKCPNHLTSIINLERTHTHRHTLQEASAGSLASGAALVLVYFYCAGLFLLLLCLYFQSDVYTCWC